jgi:hypothetical protein
MNWFWASTAILDMIDECIPISMRRIGSFDIPDECNSPVRIKRNSIEMDRRVFFISVTIY